MILILGGTGEARELAAALDGQGEAIVSSLAGRVARPRLPVGDVRIGGFGGPEAMAAWLREREVRAVVDATHPFAERISESARRACADGGVPLLVLRRPGYVEREGDRWVRVASLADAARALPGLGERVFLTTGRQGLAEFAGVDECWFLVRCVDAPEGPLPTRCEVVLDRGPFSLEGELELMRERAIEVVVCKDSGGEMTVAKLDAARALGLPVVMVARPGVTGAASPAVTTVPEALAWIAGLASHSG